MPKWYTLLGLPFPILDISTMKQAIEIAMVRGPHMITTQKLHQ